MTGLLRTGNSGLHPAARRIAANQAPEGERHVSQGITHTGVVTFHELAPRLTRIEVNMDVDPGSLIEKAGRGMRRVKRAVRADLHRFSLTSRRSQLIGALDDRGLFSLEPNG